MGATIHLLRLKGRGLSRLATVRSALCLTMAMAIGIVGLTAGTAGASVKPRQSVANVSIGTATASILNLPIYVGQSDSYFSQQGLNVKLVLLSAATQTTALLSGSVNYLTSSSAVFLQARQQDEPVVAVANDALGVPIGFVISSQFAQAHGITPKTSLKAIGKDLVGSIGGASAASTRAQSLLFLQDVGINASQVSIATLSTPAADQAALAKNQINWFVTSEPVPYEVQSLNEGPRRRYSG